ncbi:hypothetical protein F4861DRAFT_233244 [Xylaria intraflava]|nr:hypothetical protein F4861DRAFT_233244 [Xylaria intraflava]
MAVYFVHYTNKMQRSIGLATSLGVHHCYWSIERLPTYSVFICVSRRGVFYRPSVSSSSESSKVPRILPLFSVRCTLFISLFSSAIITLYLSSLTSFMRNLRTRTLLCRQISLEVSIVLVPNNPFGVIYAKASGDPAFHNDSACCSIRNV